jgi:hypothetical protein
MRRRKRQGVEIAPNPEQPTSLILKDITFTVLDGVYSLDPTGLDATVAQEEGWFDAAEAVRDKHAVAALCRTMVEWPLLPQDLRVAGRSRR